MLGSINSLMIKEICAEGAYLDGKELGEVFLSAQELEEHLEAGDSVQVFIFQDAQGHPTATTKTPIAQVGQFALLRVKALSTVGAFMDIGIDKDVLAPFMNKSLKCEKVTATLSDCIWTMRVNVYVLLVISTSLLIKQSQITVSLKKSI